MPWLQTIPLAASHLITHSPAPHPTHPHPTHRVPLTRTVFHRHQEDMGEEAAAKRSIRQRRRQLRCDATAAMLAAIETRELAALQLAIETAEYSGTHEGTLQVPWAVAP